MKPTSKEIVSVFEGWEWHRCGFGQAGENGCVPMFLSDFRKESFDYSDSEDTEVYDLRRGNWNAHLYVINSTEVIFFVVWKMIDYPNKTTVGMESPKGELFFRETDLSRQNGNYQNLGKEGRIICTTWGSFKSAAKELNGIWREDDQIKRDDSVATFQC